ncbi:hypothetical protein ACRJ4W_43520 [Streptomyces sp. GLT-R25]
MLALVDGDDGAVLVEDDAAAGRGALVDCGDELVRHDVPFVGFFGRLPQKAALKMSPASTPPISGPTTGIHE